MQKQKGITLIALIITVILLLILLGTSLGVMLNGDILGKSKKAAKISDNKIGLQDNKIEQSQDDWEKMEMDICSHIVKDGTITLEPTCTTPGKKIGKCENCSKTIEIEVPPLGHNYKDDICTRCGKAAPLPTIAAGEKAKVNSNYNGAVIPEGFTVSKAEGETTIDGGLVIYLIQDKTDEEIKNIVWAGTELENLKKTYDQFVWIPISHEQINNMFICQAKTASNGNCNITVENGTAKCTIHNSTQMAGRLYATSSGENYKKAYTKAYTANTGLREPDVVTGNSTGNGTDCDGNTTYLEYISAITGDNTSYETTAKFKETLQNDYNEIVALVYNAGGYYVGRYETSNITTTKGTAINVVAGTNSGLSNINWYYMYAQQKTYATNKSVENKVKSSMMLGTCHDQMLEFVTVEGKYDVITAGNVGHSFSSKYNTGSQNTDMSRNIYDLEGNVYEWTTEASRTNLRNCRGRCLRRQSFC